MGKRWISPLSLSLSLSPRGNDDRVRTVRLLRKKERKTWIGAGRWGFLGSEGGREGGRVGWLVGWLGGGEVERGEGGGRGGGVVVVVWGWCLRGGLVGSWLVRKERGNVGVG